MIKITEYLKGCSELHFSFEVTPDLSESVLDTLAVKPAFFSVTWHAKSHQNKNLDIPPLKMAKLLRSKNQNVLLHLSCDYLRKERLFEILTLLQLYRICNLFVILGDDFDAATSDFQSSQELVQTIRKTTGNFFCIGVAGSPESSDKKLTLLKNKVDSGADFIITQAIFDSSLFETFYRKCRNRRITVPVIPGVFIFNTKKQLNGFINMCKIKVTQNIVTIVNSTENDFNKILGEEIIENMIRSLIKKSGVNHFHIFTLNKFENVSSFLLKYKFAQ